MNGQFQETPTLRMSIPENRKQQIIVVLGRMISHRLIETSNQKEHQASKDCEDSVMMTHRAVSTQGFFQS